MQHGLWRAAILPYRNVLAHKVRSLVNHHLKGVGNIVFAFGLNFVFQHIFDSPHQFIPLAHIIESDDRLVVFQCVGLFDQLDHTTLALDHHAETPRIFYFLHEQDAICGGLFQARQVGLEECIYKDDDAWAG